MTDGPTTRAGSGRRKRDREATAEALEKALLRLQNRKQEISITAVANEAGVSPGLIHNTYPRLAEKIRKSTGRSKKQKSDAKADELKIAKATIQTLRAELKSAVADLAKLASVNARLQHANEHLKASLDAKVRQFPRGSGPKPAG